MDNLQLIQSKIYEIRGQKVMLDRDLAELYQVTTGNLNKAVKRNLKRFPPDFMFQLTVEEWEALRFQIGILKNGRGEHTKYLPYAFTEQGLAMLSGILNSDIAINVNISIMRAFVAIRQMIASPKTNKIDELEKRMDAIENYIEEVFSDYNDINDDTRIQLELINQTLAELQTKDRGFKERKQIGYKLPGCEEDDKTKY
ncbi:MULTISPECIES: ORF6N domain-containing protein [Butyricimonas]|uniref:ORF6N domain-containing protein n=1 Tax=Butyricimonas TaxID=574697 RepID=UPI0020890859|nr:ORF6N domain-containing protein [Butyricimonas paravirosa]BDF56620.1 DNA-binding protein [Odoribacteraceae bacterium]GKH95484.1 DNA-binding protein [Odoribacteraceae bacterium]GKH98108.1 DNA-binding protein [Odoribacteraceae bacterium]GKI01098.1 DNA-binding protein [Odoribacteraceae bacterium]